MGTVSSSTDSRCVATLFQLYPCTFTRWCASLPVGSVSTGVGQTHRERGATINLTCHADVTAVGVRDPLTDGEPKARSTVTARTSRIDRLKPRSDEHTSELQQR